MEPSWSLVLAGASILIPVAMLFVVPRNREPGSAIAWLLVIALVPFAGLILFLLLGNPKLPRKRRAKQAKIDAMIAHSVQAARQDGRLRELDPEYRGLARLIENLGGLPPTTGDAVQVLDDYDAIVANIAADIDAARHFVHVQYYIMALDASTRPVFDAMERAVHRGVDVRVLFDHIGSRGFPGHRRMLRHLDDIGVNWHRMLPVMPFDGQFARPDLRNHRKIVVIDGQIAYAGSQNLIDATYLSRRNMAGGLRYQEVVCRLQGPGATSLDAVFRMDWYAETGHLPALGRARRTGKSVCQVLPSGPAHPWENNLLLFNQLVYRAQRRIVLINPYFVPDHSFAQALVAAARRGVDVRLVLCEQGNHKILDHAQRSYYDRLLAAGARISLYPKPAMIHTKTLTIDDDLAVIGSSNLDMRSFHLNMEVSVLFYGPAVNAQVQAIERRYLAASEEIGLQKWRSRPLLGQVMDSLARLTASLQ